MKAVHLFPYSWLALFTLIFWACSSPQTTNPSQDPPIPKDISSYNEVRKDWRAADEALRFSASIQLSEQEKQLNDKLSALKAEMLKTYKEQAFFPPAHPFFEVKSHMEQTELFGLLQKMPKGGLLHVHDLALGSAWSIVNEAVRQPDCYVFWEEDQKPYVKGQLQFFKAEDVPKGFVSTQKMAQQDPAFPKALHELLTFDMSDMRDSLDIWVPFEKQFQMRLGFLNYKDIFVKHYVEAFDSLIADGIQHVELRSIISDAIYDLEQEDPTYYNRDTMVAYFRQAFEEVKERVPEFSLKIIYTGIRFFHKKFICLDMTKAYEVGARNPDLIVGYDLVGYEDAGNSTYFYLDCWMDMDSLANATNTQLSLFLHDGETIWPGNHNLYDALLLKTKRVGHGLNLFRFPSLENLARERNLCLEVSPLSNQILGYIPDLRNHPAIGYLHRGIPCTLNSDDPSIFNYVGLSYDFWAASLAWGLDLRDLKQLSKNALIHSSLTSEERSNALSAWEGKWDQWVKESLAEIQ